MYPNRWKYNLNLCLLHRAKMICSNSNLLNIEIRILRSYFFQNGYPNWFFDKVLEQFQTKLASQTQIQTLV